MTGANRTTCVSRKVKVKFRARPTASARGAWAANGGRPLPTAKTTASSTSIHHHAIDGPATTRTTLSRTTCSATRRGKFTDVLETSNCRPCPPASRPQRDGPRSGDGLLYLVIAASVFSRAARAAHACPNLGGLTFEMSPGAGPDAAHGVRRRGGGCEWRRCPICTLATPSMGRRLFFERR